MADIQHNLIPDDKLHQPKGAASALTGQVMYGNGDGTASFKTPNYIVGVEEQAIATHAANVVLDTANKEAVAEFDSPILGTNYSVLADGSIQLRTPGLYSIAFTGQITTDTTLTNAKLLLRMEDDLAVQLTPTVYVDLTSSDVARQNPVVLVSQIAVGDSPRTIKVHYARLGTSGGAAGFYPLTSPLSTYDNVPAMSLQVFKYQVK